MESLVDVRYVLYIEMSPIKKDFIFESTDRSVDGWADESFISALMDRMVIAGWVPF